MTSTVLSQSDPQVRTRSTLVALYAGLALTVLAALTVVLDGAGLTAHLHQTEDAWIGAARVTDTQSVLATYLFVVAGLGVLGWLTMISAVRRGKRWAPVLGTVLFLLATADALTNLLMREYGQLVLPMLHGVAGVLPCVAGLLAVVLLWRDHRAAWPGSTAAAGRTPRTG